MSENLVALAKRLVAPAAGAPYCSLSMPATTGVIRLVSVAVTLITAVASEFALIRPAVAGTPSASQFGGYLSAVTNGNAIGQINTAWAVAPTIAGTPKYLAKAFLPATIGSSFVWDFNDIVNAQGDPIPFVDGGYSASSDELELLLWNTGGGAGGIIDVTWTWKE